MRPSGEHTACEEQRCAGPDLRGRLLQPQPIDPPGLSSLVCTAPTRGILPARPVPPAVPHWGPGPLLPSSLPPARRGGLDS